MKKLLFLLLLAPLSIFAQRTSNSCIRVDYYCSDTLPAGVNSIALVARVSNIDPTDPIVSRGWIEIGTSTSVIADKTIDSTLTTNIAPGNHVFQYTLRTSKGQTITVFDNLVALAAPVVQRSIVSFGAKLVNGVWVITTLYSDGSTK